MAVPVHDPDRLHRRSILVACIMPYLIVGSVAVSSYLPVAAATDDARFGWPSWLPDTYEVHYVERRPLKTANGFVLDFTIALPGTDAGGLINLYVTNVLADATRWCDDQIGRRGFERPEPGRVETCTVSDSFGVLEGAYSESVDGRDDHALQANSVAATRSELDRTVAGVTFLSEDDWMAHARAAHTHVTGFP
jgi:hypothetical protein